MKRRGSGYTMIELMLTVAIIGLLSTIALPKFGDSITKAREAALKGQIGAMNSALTLFMANNEGEYPDILPHLEPDFINPIPMIQLPGHGRTNEFVVGFGIPPPDWGKWLYVHDPAGNEAPRITFACTHRNSQGESYYNISY